MKPKIPVCPVLGLVMAVVMCGTDVRAQNAPVSVADAARQEMILDYGKKVMAGNNPGSNAAPASEMYAREGQQLASQLQVISDNEDVNYTIVEGDTLTIAFKDRDQENRAAYKVSQLGEIFMPLLGAVKVAGLNRKQARDRISMMMKDYIREPQINIAINTDGRVMVFGAVSGPGIYNLANKMSVMEAVFAAGGFIKESAELGSVIVIRGPVEKPVILKLNLKKMIARGDRTDDVLVKPGDFIYVPTTLISNLDSFWNTMQGLLMKWYSLGGSVPIKNRGTFAW